MYVLQDWLSVAFAPTDVGMTQSASQWKRLDGFQDVTFWLELASQFGPAEIHILYETSPVKDGSLFVAMQDVDLSIKSPGEVVVTPVLATSAGTAVPVADWLRWRIHNAVVTDEPWGLTFRIHYVPKGVALRPTPRF